MILVIKQDNNIIIKKNQSSKYNFNNILWPNQIYHKLIRLLQQGVLAEIERIPLCFLEKEKK